MVLIRQGFNWPIAGLEISRLGNPCTDPKVSALASEYPVAHI